MTNHTPEQIIQKILNLQNFPGWSLNHIHEQLQASISMLELSILFPNNTSSLIHYYFQYLNSKLLKEALLNDTGTTLQVQHLVKKHFEHLALHKQATHKAINTLSTSLPQYIAIISNTIWQKVGDRSTDMSYYSKRLSLGSLLATTLLYWHASNANLEETMLFFSNRLSELFKVTNGIKKAIPPAENIQKNIMLLRKVLWN